MTAIAGGQEFPTTEDEKIALSMISSIANQADLVAIVALGDLKTLSIDMRRRIRF